MKEYFVYALRCSDGSYYTGVTNNYQLRVAQHQEGHDTSCYTYKRRPVELVYLAEFQEVAEAIHWEKVLKGWSRRKKEALMIGDENALHQLAECQNNSHSKNNPHTLSSRAETRDKVE